MNILKPRPDFTIVEDYFTPGQAAKWIQWILEKGEDSLRGFHHPDLKPNRFHKKPKYPVRRYMCLGLYWNPLDYSYYPCIPDVNVKPWPVSQTLKELCASILGEHFDSPVYSPQTVLVNFYDGQSSMGLHVDKDEEDRTAPVIGLNFGSSCRFFFEKEDGSIGDVRVPGNSIYVFGGRARLMRHGVGTIYANSLAEGSERFLKNKERISLTIRQVYA